MRNHLTKRRLGAFGSLALIAGGALIGLSSLSASGAVAMNRASTLCNFIRNQQVDPIAAYGQSPSAHQHAWYGRIDISPTTGAPLGLNPSHLDDPGYSPISTSCGFYGDWASYWFPTPKINGVIADPGQLKNTWQAPAGVHVDSDPFGENFVAGNPNSTGVLDPHAAFTCGDIDVTYTSPHDCTGVPGGVVTAQLTFPDCWDGKTGYTYPPGGVGAQTYDTPTGLAPSHFSYSTNGVCPPGQIPCVPGRRISQLVTQMPIRKPDGTPLVNPINPDGSMALSFSSGPWYTLHGDYINTWNNQLGAIVTKCMNNGVPCPPGTYVGTPDPTHQLH